MPTKTYHKLVRDRIPEIIEADGKTCVCETLFDEDYICFGLPEVEQDGKTFLSDTAPGKRSTAVFVNGVRRYAAADLSVLE